MKKLIYCNLALKAILILLLHSFAFAQNDWQWQYPKPQGNTLNDIFIFDKNTAVAVGDIGTVIKTTDGGMNWDVQHHAGGASVNLKSIHFIDKLTGWAVGGNQYAKGKGNVVLKTNDGGTSWTSVKTDTSLAYHAVYFVDKDTGIVVGEDGIVLRTTNGGNSWDTKKMDDYIGYGWLDIFDLFEITFSNKQTGWIVGAGYYGNEIYKTTDCGKTWRWDEYIIEPKIFSGLYDICFTDDLHGYIVGDMGVFLKTTDGGTTWQHQNLFEKYKKEEYQFFYSTHFTNSLTGWIVGGDYYSIILKTTDSGENWIEDTSNKAVGHLRKARFSDKDKGWIVGSAGSLNITTDGGKNWVSQREDEYYFNSIYFLDENNGWSVGGGGIILHTTDGGDNWGKQNQNDSLLLSSVYAISDQDVFVAGSVIKGDREGIIFKTNNGGQIWTKQSFDSLDGFNSITFIGDSIGFAAGSGLLKTTNKGITWYKMPIDLNRPIYNLQFINENIGWGSFYGGGSILKTTNGGKTWEQQLIDYDFNVYAFNFVDNSLGWAAGIGHNPVTYYADKFIFRTTNGGNSWIQCTNPPLSDYNSIQFISDNVGWACGGYDVYRPSSIIKTIDGGNTWYQQVSPSAKALSNIYFVNENIGWAIGDGIFKTTNGGGIVSVDNEKNDENEIPTQLELFQNYPNPFNPSTSIEYQVSRRENVTLKIYDVLGREVATLVNKEQPKGIYNIEFDAAKYYLSSGVYFFRLQAGEFAETKKMILLR
jgi:photosystem II stability/assembly factor-like uncharacterized protein